MRILWVATKSPWPPADGGRLLAAATVDALAAAGHEVVVAAPAPPGGAPPAGVPSGCRLEAVAGAAPRPWPAALPRALAGEPLAVARHRCPALAARVASLLARERFDLVQAEQVQALPACAAARRRGLPVAVRCQNVESDLWAAAAAARGGIAGAILRREAARLSAWEGRAVAGADLAFALSPGDAARLGALAGRDGPVAVVPPPFPATLPAGAAQLDGDPPLTILGAASWRPNAEGAAWFVREAWPAVLARRPGARLHVFGTLPPGRGGDAGGVVHHPPPAESATAFDPRGALLVPLLAGSGVRMKILEAWARGVPVVATPAGAAGLGATPGREYLEAGDAAAFADAVGALSGDGGLRERLVHAGRGRLAIAHDPARVAAALAALYAALRRG